VLNEKAESIKTGGPLYNVSNNALYWQMLCMWLMLYYLMLLIFYFNFLLRTRTSFCTHTSVWETAHYNLFLLGEETGIKTKFSNEELHNSCFCTVKYGYQTKGGEMGGSCGTHVNYEKCQ